MATKYIFQWMLVQTFSIYKHQVCASFTYDYSNIASNNGLPISFIC